MKNKTKPTVYECGWCGKVIISNSQSQAEYNYNLHRDACKRRIKKENDKKGEFEK